jgi:hypothetical protein
MTLHNSLYIDATALVIKLAANIRNLREADVVPGEVLALESLCSKKDVLATLSLAHRSQTHAIRSFVADER